MKNQHVIDHDIQYGRPALEGPQAVVVESNSRVSGVLDLQQLWRYILRHKSLIIILTFLITAVTYTANKLLLPTYESTAVIQIVQDNSIVRYNQISGGSSGRLDYKYIPTQMNILHSNNIVERIILNQHLENDPELTGKLRQRGVMNGVNTLVERFRKSNNSAIHANSGLQKQGAKSAKLSQMIQYIKGNLSVEEVKKTNLIRISYKSFSPETSAKIVNGIIEAYRQIEKEDALKAKEEAKQTLESKLQEVQDKLTASERRLTKLSRETGIYDIEDSGNVVNQTIQEVTSEYVKVQIEVVNLSTALDSANESDLPPSVLNDPMISEMGNKKLALEAKYRDLSEIYRPAHPDLKKIKKEISVIDENISNQAVNNQELLKSKLEAAKRKELVVKNRLAKHTQSLLDLKDQSVQFNLLKRERESNSKLYAGLMERVKLSGIASDLQLARVKVVEKATASHTPIAPNVKKNTITAAIAGLLLSLGLAGMLGLVDRRIRTFDDLSEILSYPNLALIPMVKDKPRKRGKKSHAGELEATGGSQPTGLMVGYEASPMFAESIRSLNTSLTYSSTGGFPPSLMVTSSQASEGKTTIITNLALVLQKQENKRVLVVDLDLRKPKIHKVFGISSTPGVTDYLVGEQREISNLVVKVDDFSVLPAGTLSHNAAELLESEKFESLFSELKSLYDIILVDAPPVLGLADALIISTKVDAIIMAISSEKSTTDSVKQSVSRLRSIGAHLIGTVMTKYNYDQDKYYSYYRQYYNDA